MILQFLNIKVHNFFCYADAELNLNEMGYTIVSGKNNSSIDNAISNGSGKSSIFNAICFALTGETAQGLSNNVENIYTDTNDCWVELKFRADSDLFVLRRIKAPKTDLKIYINGEDRSGKGTRESQQLLKNYLPDLSAQLVGSIIILGQGLPYRFTYNTPGARKYLLENLTKSDFMVQSIKDKLDSRKETLKQLLRESEDKSISNLTQIKIYTEQLNKLLKDLDEYSFYSSESSLDDTIENIDESIKNYQIEIEQLDSKLNKLNSDLITINNKKTNIIDSEREVYLKDRKELKDEIVKFTNLYSDTRLKWSRVKNTLDQMTKLTTGICPTCGQHVNVTEEHSHELKKLIKEENSLKIEVDQLDNKVTIAKNNSIVRENEYNSVLNEKLKECDAELEKITTEKVGLEKLLNTKTSLLNSLFYEKSKVISLKTNYSKLIEEIDVINSKLDKLNSDEAIIENNIKIINERISVVQNLITLAKREFRSVLLSNVIKYLDRKVKEYSKVVFGSELICIKTDDNYIDVMFNNKYYEALSGGEKQKVDIIIQLALKDLLSTQFNVHSNILVCDEVLDNLDAKGVEAIITILQTQTDIESIFFITHHAESLNFSYDRLISVVKNNDGISNIFIS